MTAKGRTIIVAVAKMTPVEVPHGSPKQKLPSERMGFLLLKFSMRREHFALPCTADLTGCHSEVPCDEEFCAKSIFAALRMTERRSWVDGREREDPRVSPSVFLQRSATDGDFWVVV